MYFNKTMALAVARSLAEHSSAKRALTWSGYSAGLVTLRSAVEGARVLDDLLYPDWKDQEVKEPVFIFANGRSGTTMLHRLLGYDDDTFAGFKLYQSIFSAVSMQRAIQAINEGPLASVGRKSVDAINKMFFTDTVWDGIHAMGINKEEEDETTFVYCFESPTVAIINPFMKDYTRLTWLDAHPEKKRERFMDFYEATVKKHLYSVGGGKRFLNKNVFFAPRVKAMLSRFPDARFVYLLRHPFKALPSFMSMYYEKWMTHSPELRKATPQAREMIDMGLSYYRAALELVQTLPEKNLRVVRYDDLVASPKKTVMNLYDWMGLEVSEGYEKKLTEATQKQRSYKSAHTYSLEEYGLSKDQVRRELKDVFEYYDFPPDTD